VSDRGRFRSRGMVFEAEAEMLRLKRLFAEAAGESSADRL
jgi:hypothetical protein